MRNLIYSIKTHFLAGCWTFCFFVNILFVATSGHTAVHPDSILKTSQQRKTLQSPEEVRTAGKQIVYHDGRLTTLIVSKPLNMVMKEFSRVTGVKIDWQDQESKREISAGITNRSLEEAARDLLEGESYVLFYAANSVGDQLTRIVIIPRIGDRKTKLINVVTEEDRTYKLGTYENEGNELHEFEAFTFPEDTIMEGKDIDELVFGEGHDHAEEEIDGLTAQGMMQGDPYPVRLADIPLPSWQ